MANMINLTLTANSKPVNVLSSNVISIITNGSGSTVNVLGKGARLRDLVVTQTPAQVAALANGIIAFTNLNDATTVYVNISKIFLVVPNGNGSDLTLDTGYLPTVLSVTANPAAVQALVNANAAGNANDFVNLTQVTYDFANVIVTTFDAATSVDVANDIITTVAHGYSLNDTLVFSTGGTLPTGISAATAYYVVTKTNDTYQISATRGGGVLNITGTGTGTITAKSNLFGIVSFGAQGILPNKALLVRTFVDVATSFTSGGAAQIALSTTQAANQIVSAAVLASWAAGLVEGLSDGTMANAVKLTAQREIVMPITVAVLTAGRLTLNVQYVSGS